MASDEQENLVPRAYPRLCEYKGGPATKQLAEPFPAQARIGLQCGPRGPQNGRILNVAGKRPEVWCLASQGTAQASRLRFPRSGVRGSGRLTRPQAAFCADSVG